MDVNFILELLDDLRVQEKIKLIVDNKIDNDSFVSNLTVASEQKIDNGDLFRDNQTLKIKNEEMQGLIDELKGRILVQKNEISDNISKVCVFESKVDSLQCLVKEKELEVARLNDEIRTVKDLLDTSDNNQKRTEEKLEWYRKNFSDDIKIQEVYNEFSEQTKSSLSGVFKDTSPKGLISCGIQEKNIGNLWDYAKNEVVNGINPDIDGILKLFELLFSRFIIAYPAYKIQSVQSGDEFDTQQHIKHNSSTNMSGIIDAVLLHGYLNAKTNKVIKPSIVRV
ncbi:hypothetical protein [Photobacterium alginatilyticum]|uniref:Uncharacterized protein n=1 Tax=Photobacterium alginatilyticum TaxID=1775171 RepID=A0ABW9YM02_9GAMM|nr:hypothetical protein [Photobacterium alginatilyticum]NBI54841.1 hypothetical protein [Photobacterium alginatilyticum]